MRGRTAVLASVAAGTASFVAASIVSYASQAAAPGGPATAGTWAMGAIGARPDRSAEGARLLHDYGCRTCHSVEGTGAHVGPALDRVRERKSRDEIVRWLEDPQAIKPGTRMPTFEFGPTDKQVLADYLLTR